MLVLYFCVYDLQERIVSGMWWEHWGVKKLDGKSVSLVQKKDNQENKHLSWLFDTI